MKYSLFIAGNWQTPKQVKPLYSPYSGEWIADIPDASEDETSAAIDAASQAAAAAARMPAHERSDLLQNVAGLIEENRETCARLIALEAAKPIKTARTEVARTIMTYRFSAEEARRMPTEFVNMDAAPGGEGKTAYVLREPVGPIAAITPFNFPMNLVAHKIGPAIASGNSVVLKPAEQTPLSAFFIAELFSKAGAPDGILNVITGDGKTVGRQMVEDQRIKLITFTGSKEAGEDIRARAGLKKVTLELGSNSAAVIGENTDTDRAAEKLTAGAFAFQGQLCISVQRIYVHKSKYRELHRAMKKWIDTYTAGSPLDEAADFSKLISKSETERVKTWIEKAIDSGAKILAGGEVVDGILQPTLLTNTTPDMDVNGKEVFGPVAIIEPFETWEEAVELVNDSSYGLQTGVFTNRIDEALQAAKSIESGSVLINEIPSFRLDHMPYGGVKDSGTGREGVKYAVDEMTERKLITIQA